MVDTCKEATWLYNVTADHFGPLRGRFPPEAVLDDFLTMLPERALVLDAGCGGGRLFDYVQSRGHRVVGVELSLSMLSYAPKDSARVLADIREKLFHEDTLFDGLMLINIGNNIAKDEFGSLLAKMRMHLKPQGTVVAINSKGEQDAYLEIDHLKAFLCHYTEAEFRSQFDIAGYVDVIVGSAQAGDGAYVTALARRPSGI